jgi:histidyl-tRNA synthetase
MYEYMSDKKKTIYKPKPVSGFPEWLPEERLIELQWFTHIKSVFESYGFCSIETPSVEEVDVLTAKGEIDKEIYVLERLHKDDNDTNEARLALHFDQTVPLARYVAQHFNDLIFPFKRYQIQRVWRGERPQAGRFREFYQCDIDVINIDQLPLHFDAEMPAIIWEVLSELPGMEHETIQLRISNRKILLGILQEWNVSAPEDITRAIDKIEKIGLTDVKNLILESGLSEKQAETILKVASIKTSALDELIKELNALPTNNENVALGCKELIEVYEKLSHLPEGSVIADLSIVRGLDYYTGTVYETVFTDDPTYGSICSGGRYDNLASGYINKNLPGVGISIGFSRLFSKLLDKGNFGLSRKSPADILMVLPNKEQEAEASESARILRVRGFNVELYHAPQKLKKQLSYAERKGIPYVWFPPFENGQDHEVKNMLTGQQSIADLNNWSPDKDEHQNEAA